MKILLGLFLMMLMPEVQAQSAGIPAISIDGGNGDGETYSVTLEILALMTMLTLLPAILLMMTSFTRIIIVLSILRQALGTAQTPSNQIILGLSLFLTLFVMSPVFDQVYQVAMQPYLNGSMSGSDRAIQDIYAGANA
jgi:flagellar biosynthetic protein FliP